MSDKNNAFSSALDIINSNPTLKTLSELKRLGRNPIDDIPSLKILREFQEISDRANFEHPVLKAFRAQQEKLGHIINAEPPFIKALREQQERLGHPIVNTELTVLKALREQLEILDRITSIQPASFLRALNQQQDVLSCHPIFLSLEDIRNKSLAPKEKAYEIVRFLDSEEKQKLEESLSAHSLTSWLSAVLLVYYMVREMTISSSDIDTSSQQSIQDNIQSLVSLIQSSAMCHFLISLRRNHRLGELLAQ